MLKDKELKLKQQEIIQIEADWSRSQKDIMKSKCQWQMLRQTSWQENNLNSSLLLFARKMGINTSTMHYFHLRLKSRNAMIGSRNWVSKINFPSFARRSSWKKSCSLRCLVTLFISSNTTSLPSKFMRICLLYTQLIQKIKMLWQRMSILPLNPQVFRQQTSQRRGQKPPLRYPKESLSGQ